MKRSASIPKDSVNNIVLWIDHLEPWCSTGRSDEFFRQAECRDQTGYSGRIALDDTQLVLGVALGAFKHCLDDRKTEFPIFQIVVQVFQSRKPVRMATWGSVLK